MHLQETIFCATASSSGSGAISLHDIVTGSSLASFKQTNAVPHCTVFLESKNAQGGVFFAAQPDKSLLHVYNFQKDQISLKIVLPEKLTCVALDPRGDYFAGGTTQGRIHLWEASPSDFQGLLDVLTLRNINVLRFTQDGAALISGSDDSSINVWSVARLLDEDTQNELALPYFTLTDHTLPITDIICGVGSFPTCRILTSSIDHSVKVCQSFRILQLTPTNKNAQFSSGTSLPNQCSPRSFSLSRYHLSHGISQNVFFFAASSEGSIYQMNLYRHREDKSKGPHTEAIGGGGVNDMIRVDDESTDAHNSSKKRLIAIGHPITSLTISLTSSLLVVGTSSGLIQIYDIPTHQLLRTISSHRGFSVTHLSTMLKPIDLVGHVNLRMNVNPTQGAGANNHSSDTRETIPVKSVVPFQRMRDTKTREVHEVSMVLPVQRHRDENHVDSDLISTCYPYSKSSFLRDHAYFTQYLSSSSSDTDTSTSTSTSSLQSKITSLEAEVIQLREQLGQAKGINNAMWETVVQKVVGTGKKATTTTATATAMQVDGEGDEGEGDYMYIFVCILHQSTLTAFQSWTRLVNEKTKTTKHPMASRMLRAGPAPLSTGRHDLWVNEPHFEDSAPGVGEYVLHGV
ncbi:hypothetical protein D9758_006052 [Tetrapyrgos nigripes]|uniref:Pre-rRNA-processing protein IPI3 n=1 Tax=Tetrapyrgos nigripes TaxID=182062 RepID=A0A8H5FZE3_9AGAR|nr:hypothetical protein D9758_006052 [Tetrapyrgos nigripes]